MVIKWVIAIVVVAGGAWLLWWSGWLNNMQPTPAEQTGAATQATSNQPAPTLNGMSAANDSSDAALAQDTAAVDAQMQGLVSDSSGVDASVNDKATAQAY